MSRAALTAVMALKIRCLFMPLLLLLDEGIEAEYRSLDQ